MNLEIKKKILPITVEEDMMQGLFFFKEKFADECDFILVHTY